MDFLNRFKFFFCSCLFILQMNCNPLATLEDEPTDYKFQASSFFEEFLKNEEVSNLKYRGKTLEIIGTIHAIKKSSDESFQVFLNSHHEKGAILCICKDLSTQQLRELSVGQIIHVKGTFAGYEHDVLLSPCVII